jgi:hypothetical protein
MFFYDRYENPEPPLPETADNCFQTAVRIAADNDVDNVYWVEEYEHYYVVVPGKEYALGERADKPRLKSRDVEENGIPHTVSDLDVSVWG